MNQLDLFIQEQPDLFKYDLAKLKAEFDNTRRGAFARLNQLERNMLSMEEELRQLKQMRTG